MVLDDLGRDFLRKHQIKHVDHQRTRLRFLIRFVRQAHRRPEIPVHSERKLVLLISRVQKPSGLKAAKSLLKRSIGTDVKSG